MTAAALHLEVTLVLSNGKSQTWTGVTSHRADGSERVHTFVWEHQTITLYLGADATLSVTRRA